MGPGVNCPIGMGWVEFGDGMVCPWIRKRPEGGCIWCEKDGLPIFRADGMVLIPMARRGYSNCIFEAGIMENAPPGHEEDVIYFRVARTDGLPPDAGEDLPVLLCLTTGEAAAIISVLGSALWSAIEGSKHMEKDMNRDVSLPG